MTKHTDKLNTVIQHRLDGLIVDVRILDIRELFGRVEYLITPVKGSGSKWVVARQNNQP